MTIGRVLDPRGDRSHRCTGVFVHEARHPSDAVRQGRCRRRASLFRSRARTAAPAANGSASVNAYGLAACWLNRAEALTSLGPAHHALALRAYDEALALLRPRPLGDDARFSKRLAIAYQNRALVLAAQNPPATADAIAALVDAIAVLDHAETMDAPERNYFLAVVWMNLANIQASEATIVSDLQRGRRRSER